MYGHYENTPAIRETAFVDIGAMHARSTVEKVLSFNK